ncbi:MAG: hypothetical protein HQL54_02765 [Magnetococcales bacterium]|nr:hypothetical protein [Magnetococcales bacterium]
MTIKTTATALLMTAFLATAPAHSTESQTNYQDSVNQIVVLHLDALKQLTKHTSPYSDNVVRHAIALEQTAGLLDDQALEGTVLGSRKQVKDLLKAARDWMKHGNRAKLITTLNALDFNSNQ